MRRAHGCDGSIEPTWRGLTEGQVRDINWRLLIDSCVGAHSRNSGQHLGPLRQLSRDVPPDGQGISIVFLLLALALNEAVGDPVDEQTVRHLARAVYPNWGTLVGQPPSVLEELLLTPVGLIREDRAIKGANLLVYGTAALGLIMKDPSTDIPRLRPFVDEWWSEFGVRAQTEGQVEYRWRAPGS